MCGRFNLKTPSNRVAETFGLAADPGWEIRFNIAPTQPIPVILEADGMRQGSEFQWGLVPSWVKDPTIGHRMFNARGETVATKPSFRSAFQRRRCLIPADGFYEWQKGRGKTKQPFQIRLHDEQTMAFAGLWERWLSADGSELFTCTIITTEANSLLVELHERMPVILEPNDFGRWLDPELQEAEGVEDLLRPYPADSMMMNPVNPIVNNARNETPRCIEPAPRETLF